MQALIIALLCVINLVLWLIFFLKFKRLFSTDDVIQKTREQYDLLLTDVNRNALQNIDLIQMKIDELQALIDVADRRLSTIDSEQNFINQKKQLIPESKAEKAYSRKNPKSDNENIASAVIDQDQAFELDFDLKKVKRKSAAAVQEEKPARRRNLKSSSSDSLKSEPLPVTQTKKQPAETDNGMPRIYMSANPIQTQKTFQEQVRKLYDAGYTVDQIAHELNKSTTEVELIVEML